MPTGHIRVLVELVNDRMPLGVEKLYGRRHVDDSGIYPRVIWVPDSEQIDATATGYHRNGSDPKSIKLRVCTVEAHIWGADEDATEELLADVVTALNLASAPTGRAFEWALAGGQWIDAKGAKTAAGVGYVLRVIVKIPIVLGESTRVAPLTLDLTRTFIEPVTGDETTES